MSNSWFSVENNLIDRNDLDIYEKMCSVVLARYAGRAEFSNMLNIQVVAIRMGCSVEQAERALNSLIAKRLVTLEDTECIEPEMLSVEAVKVNSRVIRSEAQDEAKPQAPSAFESLENFDEEKPVKQTKRKSTRKKKAEAPAEELKEALISNSVPKEVAEAVADAVAKETAAKEVAARQAAKETPQVTPTPRPVVPKQVREGVQDLIDQIFDIVDENINDREARIILSFANNDVELVREKYKIAKRSQVSDKIEMLINELQRKDEPADKRAGESRVREQSEGGRKAEETPSVKPMPKGLQNTQIDLENINRMVAIKQNSYGKQGNKIK